ncbi:uncharacterized protein BX663DRAFT_519111 [Cokeromyces recurvatus]|uniref:uncharacterized protein n=1 Tax=Cokeromyces recurvatus TaxID=90255 RepID=UPI00222110B8|nr:uncharacterized protein BX663DRAFT_519111 [Cokeromyces recurvatus]KAI7899957.1 hypothetical protein BX663DRAFT_519111 [Cokeromyces recurvatus]
MKTKSLHNFTLPKNIVSNNADNDSFSRDLLRQFDKRRSRLHFELGFISQEPSPESSLIQTPQSSNDYSDQEPVQLDQIEEQQQQEQEQYNYKTSNTSKQSSTASAFLRRSSAYLKSKLDSIRKNNKPNHNDVQRPKPTRLLMKTTISIPSTVTKPKTNPSVIPPSLTTTTITQYPPKPLVYSPIEPIITPSEDKESTKPLLHRISMPLIRVYHDSSTSIIRHKSIASFVNRRRKSEPDQRTKKKFKKVGK